MKPNKYFKEYEFKCKCGKCELPPNVPSDQLVDLLCEIREFLEILFTLIVGIVAKNIMLK